MLKLTDIRKVYKAASGDVVALKGVNLEFRENEFVCILGHSGCGKTTLLNIIGGLDHYTSGDLVIQGRSTKNYKDRDWDIYRNHRIGFIFQTYYLIPHQTVLGNVELALTIAGVGKEERRRRATDALRRVGLEKELHKRPNQLSGGQMQRVAIARALVNNPDILLADEPTGALDSETSVQIMELIKEIAGERLVIMVTHNPELAYRYATRIVKFKDGMVESDSMPYDSSAEEEHKQEADVTVDSLNVTQSESAKVEESQEAPSDVLSGEGNTSATKPVMSDYPEKETKTKKGKKEKKPRARMSFLASLALSAKNLLTKKGRTVLTSVAGSIGIISVSLVLALSNGFNNYVKKTEEDMLSYYPVTISESSLDMTSLMSSFSSPQNLPDLEQIGNKVYVDSFLTGLAEGLTIKNNISQDYLDYIADMDPSLCAAIQYGYGTSIVDNLFTHVQTAKDPEASEIELQTTTRSLSNLKEYYIEVVYRVADEYKGLVKYADLFANVVSRMPGTSDFSSDSFGKYVLSQYDVIAGNFPTNQNEIVLVVGANNQVSDLTLAQLGLLDEKKFAALFELGKTDDDDGSISEESVVDFDQIVGKEYTLFYNDAVYHKNPDYQKPTTTDAGNKDSFPYEYVGELEKESDLYAQDGDGINLKVSGILRLKDGLTYGCLTSGLNLTEALIDEYINATMESAKEDGTFMNWVTQESILTFSFPNPDFGKPGLEDEPENIEFSIYLCPSKNLANSYYDIDSELDYALAGMQDTTLQNLLKSLLSRYVATFSPETAIRAMGGDNSVTTISFYAKDFDSKEQLLVYLDAWNNSHEQNEQVKYSDTVGLLMGMVQQILDIITYVLVAFTSISLVVSSVMIGIITYVSVVERIKEIGILRSLGARKQDVRNLFNAETFIIGLAAGLIGIGLSYFISLFINIAIQTLTGIAGIAALPFTTALIMVLVSVVLTLISGLIPAQSAAKKDPVIALRTE